MSGSVASLAAYPQLAQALRLAALSQQLGMPTDPTASPAPGAGNAPSPMSSSGIISALLAGKSQADVLTGMSGGLQGANPGTLTADSDESLTAPAPAPPAVDSIGAPASYTAAARTGTLQSGLPASVGLSIADQESNYGRTAPNNPLQITSATAANPGYGVPPISAADMADPTKATVWAMNYGAARARAAGYDPSTPEGAAVAASLYNGGGTPGYSDSVMLRAGYAPGSYNVASGDSTRTDVLPSPDAPPSYMTGAPSGGVSAPGQPAAPTSNPMSQGLTLYRQGMVDGLSPDPLVQQFGQQETDLGRMYLQRGQFQNVVGPNGVTMQRNMVTGQESALPSRPVTTVDGVLYDSNTGQPIAGGVGAGGVRSQDVRGAALNTLAQLAPRIASGQASPQERIMYSSAATAFRGQPQTYQKPDGTTGIYLSPLPPGLPDPSMGGGIGGAAPPAGAPAGTPGVSAPPSLSSGMPVSGGSLPGPTRAASALPQAQAQATGTALVSRVGDLRTAGQTGQRVVDQVGQIKQAMASATANGLPQGYFSPELGEAAAAAKYLGLNIPGLQPGAVTSQQVADSTLKQFGGAVLKGMFPSRITNADLHIFLPSMGDLSHDPQAVSKILDNANAYASYDVNKQQAMEHTLAANNGQLPPTWEANYNEVHGAAARLAPIPSSGQAVTLGWTTGSVPADVSNLNGFGIAPAKGAAPVGTVATGANGAQTIMTMLGWRSYVPGRGVID